MLEVVGGELAGARKSTCGEAKKLLGKDKVYRVFWRPDGIVSKENPDLDTAFVWYVNEPTPR